MNKFPCNTQIVGTNSRILASSDFILTSNEVKKMETQVQLLAILGFYLNVWWNLQQKSPYNAAELKRCGGVSHRAAGRPGCTKTPHSVTTALLTQIYGQKLKIAS